MAPQHRMRVEMRFRWRYASTPRLGKDLVSTRFLMIVLVLVGIGLQADLWLTDDGYLKTINLRKAVAEQRALNDGLRDRNAALDAEVINLKRGRDAAEERARTDLGMIGEQETFYQVVPLATSTS